MLKHYLIKTNYTFFVVRAIKIGYTYVIIIPTYKLYKLHQTSIICIKSIILIFKEYYTFQFYKT